MDGESPVFIDNEPQSSGPGREPAIRWGQFGIQDANLGDVRSTLGAGGWSDFAVHPESAIAESDSMDADPDKWYPTVRERVRHELQALAHPHPKYDYDYKSGDLTAISEVKTEFTVTAYPFLRTSVADDRWDEIAAEDGVRVTLSINGKHEDRQLKLDDKAKALIYWHASNCKNPSMLTGIRLGEINSTWNCRYVNKQRGWTSEADNFTWNWWDFTPYCALGWKFIDDGHWYKVMGYTKAVDLLSKCLTDTLGVRSD